MAYPYGDIRSANEREFKAAADAGYFTAVTTRPGPVKPKHIHQLLALPRISLRGDMQDISLVEVMVSGFPFLMKRG